MSEKYLKAKKKFTPTHCYVPRMYSEKRLVYSLMSQNKPYSPDERKQGGLEVKGNLRFSAVLGPNNIFPVVDER